MCPKWEFWYELEILATLNKEIKQLFGLWLHHHVKHDLANNVYKYVYHPVKNKMT
jgi:hypothetical protein